MALGLLEMSGPRRERVTPHQPHGREAQPASRDVILITGLLTTLARIPDHIIEQVREAHDVVEIVQRAVQLKQAGGGYKGLCPFHDEKTPSFTVHPGRQTFKCFGCGKGGNIFGFVMETQGLNFPEAVRQLAEERGIDVPSTGVSDPALDERFERIRRALGVAHRLYVRTLASDEGRESRAYLAKRGYDAEAVRRFGLGMAPLAWDRVIEAGKAAGLSTEDLEDAGLIIPRRTKDGFYDRFRNRIMFPIADTRGRLCTFAGRALDPDDPAKYMNGPETVVFKKSEVLYALHRARDAIRKQGEALLMEGYTDVLMCHLNDFSNAVAGMGTAFTERQAKLLGRQCERVVLVYDSDDAGRAAAEKSVDMLLLQGLEVRIALLPEGRDVDEILQEEGPEAFQAVLDASLEFFDFKLAAAGTRHDLESPRGRAQASEEILASVIKVKSELERDQLLRMIGDRLGGGPDTEAALRRRAGELLRESARPAGLRSLAAPKPPAEAPPVPQADGHFEQVPVEFLTPQPELDDESVDGASADGVPGSKSPGGLVPPPPRRAPTMDSMLAELDLLGAILANGTVPGSLPEAIFRAVGPEEFTDPAHSRLYNALLAHWEAGEVITSEVALARFQSDSEVTAVLAGMPEDEGLAERVTSWIAFTEQNRLEIDHQREVARLARGDVMVAVSDPDASYFDESPAGADPLTDEPPSRSEA